MAHERRQVRGRARATIARTASRRTLACAVAGAVALAPWTVGTARAAFGSVVHTSGTSFAALVVPVPTGLACSGLGSLATSRIVWNAVTPPPGDAVLYVVTKPGGATTTTAATSFQLPPVTLPGQYGVQTLTASGWRSRPATITVGLTVLGLLYTCGTP